ncbi:MAG: hypothetical protein Aurels2KO_32330 [Aureliella sp.]
MPLGAPELLELGWPAVGFKIGDAGDAIRVGAGVVAAAVAGIGPTVVGGKAVGGVCGIADGGALVVERAGGSGAGGGTGGDCGAGACGGFPGGG